MAELFSNLIPQVRFLYKAVLMAVFLSIAYLFFKDSGWKDKVKVFLRKPWLVAFFIYAGYLLSSTVVGRYVKTPYLNVLGSFGFVNKDGGMNVDLWMNVIMFIPFTILYIVAFRPADPLKTSLILSAGTAVFIELSQLIGWLGEFQIADMLHNFMGGVLGYGLWLLVHMGKELNWLHLTLAAIRKKLKKD